MSPFPRRCSAPITSRMVRESTRVATRKLMRAGKLALIRPVMTSTLGRCVASTRCMPTARAICASRVTRFFDVVPFQHHQVGQLVDEDEDVGQRLGSSSVAALPRTGCAAAAAIADFPLY